MFNFLKKVLSIFIIFNLTFVTSAQAAATFDDINGDGTGFDVSDQGTNARSVAFNNDGTKMFVVDKAHEEINVYTLTTGFDLSTATFNDINGDGTGFDVSGQEANPQGIAFNNDGTKMFVVGTSGDDVNEYTLSVGFDLTSTVTFVDSFDISGQEESAWDVEFNNDGTKMFVTGMDGVDVNQYTLSTGFDLTSTVTFVDSFDVSGQDNRPRGMAFNNDGTKMFVVGFSGEDVNVYTLSTGFDLTSTVTFVDSFDVSNEDDGPVDIAFNNTGSKMFVVGLNDEEINSYSLSCGFKITNSGKCEEPPKIKDVRGIVDAQINTAKKIIEDTKVSTFKRLDILRANKYHNTSAQNIELLFQNELFKKVSNNVASPIQAKLNPIQKLDQILSNDWKVWNEGSISFGKIGGDSLSSAQEIDRFGLTVGADRKMDDDQILGVALRVGNTDVNVGTFGSKVDTNALSLSVYGINSLVEKNFLKHVFGVSYLDSDIRRNDEGNTNSHTGDRKGKQFFGSLDIGREYEDGDLNISSIGSIDGSYTALDSYTEIGSNAISYNDQDIKSLMASLGVLIDKDVNLENSNVKSRVNLEYSKDFASNSKVVTSYVSDSESFEYKADNKNRDIYTAGLGLDFKHDEGLTISTDYERQQIKGHGYINKFTFSAGYLYRNETELAFNYNPLKDHESSLSYSKNINGFDFSINHNHIFDNSLEYDTNVEVSSTF